MRGVRASFGGAVVLAATLLVAPASSAEQPTTAAGLLAHYYDLSKEAERVNEELLIAQEKLATQQQASAAAKVAADQATAAAVAARAQATRVRDLDRVANALAARRGLDALSAFAESSSPDEVLGRLEATSLGARLSGGPGRDDPALLEAERTSRAAQDAEAKAATAEAAVAAGAADAQRRRADLDRQIGEVRTALAKLTPEQRDLLAGVQDYGGDVVYPGGDVGAMLQFAMRQLGKPYLWGAIGPDAYDCSGLVLTAYRSVGVNLPRVSRQQALVGQAVPRSDVRPGDLIFYYEPVHHVAIAVDDVRALHAPSFGETVKLGAIDAIGPITVIRRVIR